MSARATAAGGVFLLSLMLFMLTGAHLSGPPAWCTFEFCQYAEIGRNLAEHGRWETRLVTPMALAYIDRFDRAPHADAWPVIERFPLPCLASALAIKLGGASDAMAALPAGIEMSALAALTFWLAATWMGWAAGWVTALLFLANPSFFGYFLFTGEPDVLFAVIFLLQVLVFIRLVERPSARTGVLFGVLSGLAFLCRFNAGIPIAIQVAFLCYKKQWRPAALGTAVCALMTVPFFAYDLHHFGMLLVPMYSQENLLDQIGLYPVEPWLYYHVISLPQDFWPRSGAFAAKWWHNMTYELPLYVWLLWHFWVMLPLAVYGARLQHPGRRVLLWCGGFFLLQLVMFAALRLELDQPDNPITGRYFFWFAVPALLLGVRALMQIDRRLAAVLVVLQLGVYAHTWAAWGSLGPRPQAGRDRLHAMLAQAIPHNAIVASDEPQVLLWDCGLKTLALPADPTELQHINQQSRAPVDYIFINLNLTSISLDPRWAALVTQPGSAWEQQVLKDYTFNTSPDVTRRYGFILLRRRAVPPPAPQ
ncbi:MAG: ArnT family glycosyltransferase [Candidatus Xenobia bacterium]